MPQNINATQFYFEMCTPNEISALIQSLSVNKSCGPNSIPVFLLKELKDIVSIPLAFLFNKTFSSGTFPEIFKLAKVIPVFKKGDRNKCSNYRPISLLSNIGKLLEKVVHHQLYKYFEDNKLLYKFQFGFRLNTSTSHALINIVDKIERKPRQWSSYMWCLCGSSESIWHCWSSHPFKEIRTLWYS